jgi:predicted TIM-barrel fold metal-dependent hydrolase
MPLDKTTDSPSAAIRAKLDHPVIDADGHTVEHMPLVFEYVEKVAGRDVANRLRRNNQEGEAGSDGGPGGWYNKTPEERAAQRIYRPPFFMQPAKNSLDRATAMFPNLFRKRLDEFGIDYAIVYTSAFRFQKTREDELRQAGCRALNVMHAEMFAEHADRMTAAAVIPCHTPEEAVAELEYSVRTLGLKTAMISGNIPRSVKKVEEVAPHLAGFAQWIDPLGMASLFNYDPLWAKCVELKVAPTAHTTGFFGARTTPTSYVYNHIGNFGAANEAFCKALFLGGVTHRFPTLKFGFLEGGVAWACSLYADLFEHWEKRNAQVMRDSLHPKNVDHAFMAEMAAEYGGPQFAAHVDQMRQAASVQRKEERDVDFDEFKDCPIAAKKEIHDRFIPNFYYGCEADDRMVSAAFNTKANRFGAKLKAIFSSDVGHWDVPQMNEVLSEAHELVEHELITADDFRAFTFANVAEFHATMNPDFFKGTVIEKDVAKALGR